MQVLLTGVTGRIGSYVFWALNRRHHQIVLLIRASPPKEIARASSAVIKGDMADPAAWGRAMEGVEAVVHLGGVSENRPDVIEANVGAAHNLVRACDEFRIAKVVFASSNCVLGHCDRPRGRRYRPDYLPIDESHPIVRGGDYGHSKRLSEQTLEAATERGSLQVVALRPAWVWRQQERRYRRGMAWEDQAFSHLLWAYVDAEDCAEAFALSLESDVGNPFEAIYLSAADSYADADSEDLARTMFPEAGRPDGPLVGRQGFFSVRKAQEILGWQPTRTWRD